MHFFIFVKQKTGPARCLRIAGPVVVEPSGGSDHWSAAGERRRGGDDHLGARRRRGLDPARAVPAGGEERGLVRLADVAPEHRVGVVREPTGVLEEHSHEHDRHAVRPGPEGAVGLLLVRRIPIDVRRRHREGGRVDGRALGRDDRSGARRRRDLLHQRDPTFDVGHAGLELRDLALRRSDVDRHAVERVGSRELGRASVGPEQADDDRGEADQGGDDQGERTLADRRGRFGRGGEQILGALERALGCDHPSLGTIRGLLRFGDRLGRLVEVGLRRRDRRGVLGRCGLRRVEDGLRRRELALGGGLLSLRREKRISRVLEVLEAGFDLVHRLLLTALGGFWGL